MFEVHTVSYGPSFPLLIYDPSTKHKGHKWEGEMRIHILQYGPRKIMRLVRYLYLYCASDRLGNYLCSCRSGFKFLTHLESKTTQFEIVVERLLSL